MSGLPLKELSLDNAVSTDLLFVQGMPLERLFVSRNASGPTDFASLPGLRLKVLGIRQSGVRDLSFLRGMPLEKLILQDTGVPDFESLRGLPLRVFAMIQTVVPTDLSPLLDCPTLESIIIPPGTDPTVLRRLPRLRHLSTRRTAHGWDHTPAQTAEEFWKEFDAKTKQTTTAK